MSYATPGFLMCVCFYQEISIPSMIWLLYSKRRVVQETILAQINLYLLEKTPFRVIIAKVWKTVNLLKLFLTVQSSKWQRRKMGKEKNGSKSEPTFSVFPEKDPMYRNAKLPINLGAKRILTFNRNTTETKFVCSSLAGICVRISKGFTTILIIFPWSVWHRSESTC